MQVTEKDAKITITISKRDGVVKIFGSVTRRKQPLAVASGNPAKLQQPGKLSRPRKRSYGGTEEAEEAIVDASGHPKWIDINSSHGKQMESARCKFNDRSQEQLPGTAKDSQSVDKFSQRCRKLRSGKDQAEPAQKRRKHKGLLS
ncbi:hypothetical protein TWF481_006303 [Arthrobotrys musiformis]|uniref:Uncharacterized protein n=1 Tax=Arthrobotrys musiformis TaxID=47236 RepID=A0AAV9WGD2_9PEZI